MACGDADTRGQPSHSGLRAPGVDQPESPHGSGRVGSGGSRGDTGEAACAPRADRSLTAHVSLHRLLLRSISPRGNRVFPTSEVSGTVSVSEPALSWLCARLPRAPPGRGSRPGVAGGAQAAGDSITSPQPEKQHAQQGFSPGRNTEFKFNVDIYGVLAVWETLGWAPASPCTRTPSPSSRGCWAG